MIFHSRYWTSCNDNDEFVLRKYNAPVKGIEEYVLCLKLSISIGPYSTT